MSSRHEFGIKAACHSYDAFFEEFGHLLQWRIRPRSPAAAGRHAWRGDDDAAGGAI